MLASLIRSLIRSALINNGDMTCSDIVRSMGLDPVRHKGTIHGFMVDLEDAGVLTATRKNGRRHMWSIRTESIRNRDRLAAVVM
jgi:hypothetical protein